MEEGPQDRIMQAICPATGRRRGRGRGIASRHLASRDRELLGADGDGEISGGVCVRVPMLRVWGWDDASGDEQGHGGWMVRVGAQARSTMQLVIESCDSETCLCIDGSSRNDTSRRGAGM